MVTPLLEDCIVGVITALHRADSRCPFSRSPSGIRLADVMRLRCRSEHCPPDPCGEVAQYSNPLGTIFRLGSRWGQGRSPRERAIPHRARARIMTGGLTPSVPTAIRSIATPQTTDIPHHVAFDAGFDLSPEVVPGTQLRPAAMRCVISGHRPAAVASAELGWIPTWRVRHHFYAESHENAGAG